VVKRYQVKQLQLILLQRVCTQGAESCQQQHQDKQIQLMPIVLQRVKHMQSYKDR
jgi:hypothetical protein